LLLPTNLMHLHCSTGALQSSSWGITDLFWGAINGASLLYAAPPMHMTGGWLISLLPWPLPAWWWTSGSSSFTRPAFKRLSRYTPLTASTLTCILSFADVIHSLPLSQRQLKNTLGHMAGVRVAQPAAATPPAEEAAEEAWAALVALVALVPSPHLLCEMWPIPMRVACSFVCYSKEGRVRVPSFTLTRSPLSLRIPRDHAPGARCWLRCGFLWLGRDPPPYTPVANSRWRRHAPFSACRSSFPPPHTQGRLPLPLPPALVRSVRPKQNQPMCSI
jgi:hypothetical protein